MIKPFKTLILITGILSAMNIYANNNDITGKWRSIDDKTGFSKAIIEINKDQNGIYSGKIIDITPRPGYTPQSKCTKCKGENQNKPILGLKILQDTKRNPTRPEIFSGGTILDPLNGNQYKTSIRLNTDGSRLSIRGFIGVEALGRNQTWLRIN